MPVQLSKQLERLAGDLGIESDGSRRPPAARHVRAVCRTGVKPSQLKGRPTQLRSPCGSGTAIGLGGAITSTSDLSKAGLARRAPRGAKKQRLWAKRPRTQPAFHPWRALPWSPSINRSKTPRPFSQPADHAKRGRAHLRGPTQRITTAFRTTASAPARRRRCVPQQRRRPCRQPATQHAASLYSTPGRGSGRKPRMQRCRAPAYGASENSNIPAA